MGRGARLLRLLRPYKLLFATNIVATVLSSVLDGATFVLLIPFLRALFGEHLMPEGGGSAVEGVLQGVAGARALASLLQNVSLIVVYLAILTGLSWRLTLIALVSAPLLALIIRPLTGRVRRRSREQADARGGLTALVSELVASIKLVRAYVAEAFETDRFRTLADRYRRSVLRAQRYAALTSPVSEMFAGVVIVVIIWTGTQLALGRAAALRREGLIALVAAALRL